MPIITLENAGTIPAEKKIELIAKLTETASKILDKPERAFYVRIDEVPRENFGVGGKPLG